jgi:hypothetical protein
MFIIAAQKTANFYSAKNVKNKQIPLFTITIFGEKVILTSSYRTKSVNKD